MGLEPGKICFEAPTQQAKRRGTIVVVTNFEIFQCLIDFPVSGFLTKRFAQGSHELLGRFCDQSAADTATDGVEGTDVSRIPFFICRGSGQGKFR